MFYEGLAEGANPYKGAMDSVEVFRFLLHSSISRNAIALGFPLKHGTSLARAWGSLST